MKMYYFRTAVVMKNILNDRPGQSGTVIFVIKNNKVALIIRAVDLWTLKFLETDISKLDGAIWMIK